MTETVSDSVTKILDALQDAAPGFIERAAQAERVSSIVAIAVSFLAVAVSVSALVFVYRTCKDSDHFEMLMFLSGIAAVFTAIVFLAATPAQTGCVMSPDYCVVKGLVGSDN